MIPSECCGVLAAVAWPGSHRYPAHEPRPSPGLGGPLSEIDAELVGSGMRLMLFDTHWVEQVTTVVEPASFIEPVQPGIGIGREFRVGI